MVVPTMETLPRVPDTHGDTVDEKLFSDMYIRTSWFDATIALDQIEKGKARGRRHAVHMRSVFQSHLFNLGCSIQKHAGKVLFVAILVLCSMCVGLKSATVHSKVHQLWIQEGGRLEEELKYTHKSLGETDSSTHQLLIQTPHDRDASVLHPQALLTHLEVVKQAASVTLHMYEIEWSLKDMCYSPHFPNFESHMVEMIFENIIPCAIITPLDCFWEGSKLLGPDYPVRIPNHDERVQWTSLHPQNLLAHMKKMEFQFPFASFEQHMKKAGITTGYTEKPCLDPRDPLCPATAPNKNGTIPDIGATLTGGCYGFASAHMHWPEELVVGGVTRNKTGHIKKAKALQSVIQLMGEREMYEYWREHYRVHNIEWSQDRAAEILNAWQKKFSAEVHKIMKARMRPNYDFYAFSSATLDDILGKYSNPNPVNLGIGMAAILLYTGLTLVRFKDMVNSQCAVGIAGVVLIGVTTAAGLGVCAVLGIAFNAATTQVVPFLALGLGVDHIFILTHAYGDKENKDNAGQVLKKAGLSVLFSAATTAGAFFTAALIPVPALRVFCLQAAILLVLNLAAVLLIFPAMISLDIKRRRSRRNDIFCCCLPPLNLPHVEAQSKASPNESLMGSDTKQCISFSLTQFAGKYYAPFLTNSSTKTFGMLTLIGVVCASLFASMKLSDGLELTDLVPQTTDEHKFLSIQGKLFGFYNMFAITQGDFEYPTNQQLLHDYNDAFVRIPHVIKNDNGGIPDFWLGLFRDWLKNLQYTFDNEYREGRITQERWFSNASDDAILAYKLLVQTGHVDNPIDKTLVTTNRLVKDDIINPKAFYNYLSAWAWNDALAYGASQCNLRPEPREWIHASAEFDLKIPKSAPLTYTQLPYYLHGLSDTTEIKTLIGLVRELSEKYEARGLPNYPSGIPFLFWEQYMNLRPCLFTALGYALGATFVLVGLLLLSAWAALLIVFSAVVMLIQLLGVMMILGIKLSAIPAVILVASVGIGVCFTVHISLGFITSIGSRDRRIRLALEHAMAPVIHGVLTSTLAVLMLSTSPFEFVVRHFLWLLLSVMLIGAVNGLFFFPILLSLIGPAAEIVPLQHANRISTPTPPPKRNNNKFNYSNKPLIVNTKRSSSSSSSQSSSYPRASNKGHYHPNKDVNNSLTTITEEGTSWKSSASSIASACDGCSPSAKDRKNNINGSSGNSSSGSSSSCSNGGMHVAPELQKIVLQPEVTVETHHNGGDLNGGSTKILHANTPPSRRA